MTDIEREAFFKRKHDEVVKQLLGDVDLPVTADAGHIAVDKNWSKGKSFYDQPRIHKGQAPVNDGIRDWNEQLRTNNGWIVRHIEEEQQPTEAAND